MEGKKDEIRRVIGSPALSFSETKHFSSNLLIFHADIFWEGCTSPIDLINNIVDNSINVSCCYQLGFTTIQVLSDLKLTNAYCFVAVIRLLIKIGYCIPGGSVPSVLPRSLAHRDQAARALAVRRTHPGAAQRRAT